MHRLENKIALITGAARGIGKAIAELFHKEDAKVIITDIRDDEGKDIARSLPDRNEYLHLDGKYEDGWKQIEEYLYKKYGSLDILKMIHQLSAYYQVSPEDFRLSSEELQKNLK